MTITHTGKKIIEQQYCYPSKTTINAQTFQAVFEDFAIKKLLISAFIDMYNHFMNGVDLADQF